MCPVTKPFEEKKRSPRGGTVWGKTQRTVITGGEVKYWSQTRSVATDNWGRWGERGGSPLGGDILIKGRD